jgi:hypothetical protein
MSCDKTRLFIIAIVIEYVDKQALGTKVAVVKYEQQNRRAICSHNNMRRVKRLKIHAKNNKQAKGEQTK